MKAPAFQYLRPTSLEECLAALAEHGDDAQVLAGGQSLMPMLNLRLTAPAVLIDIGRLGELKSMRREAAELVLGALQTHADIGVSEAVRRHAPMLSDAAPHIAHVAIRARGTIGGSVALADPAAEWPACCLALNAEIELASTAGARRVPADDFFHDLYTTDRRPDELVTAIRFPRIDSHETHIFDEVGRRRGDFAIAGLALVCRSEARKLAGVRMAFLGVGGRPVLARRAMSTLEGATLREDAIEAAADALADELEPPEDPAYPAGYRRSVACALLKRTLQRLTEMPSHAA